MISNSRPLVIVITHTPSGISATVDSAYSRSETKCKQMAMKLLRSKLYAHYQMSAHNYEFPDDVQYPNEVSDFKIDVTGMIEQDRT